MADYRLLPIALEELDHALNWYRARSPASARRFAEQVENALAAIETTPHRFAKWDVVHRYGWLKKFPYFIAYRVVVDIPLIVAIRHTSQGDVSLADR